MELETGSMTFRLGKIAPQSLYLQLYAMLLNA
jgi:hypothetical protein